MPTATDTALSTLTVPLSTDHAPCLLALARSTGESCPLTERRPVPDTFGAGEHLAEPRRAI